MTLLLEVFLECWLHFSVMLLKNEFNATRTWSLNLAISMMISGVSVLRFIQSWWSIQPQLEGYFGLLVRCFQHCQKMLQVPCNSIQEPSGSLGSLKMVETWLRLLEIHQGLLKRWPRDQNWGDIPVQLFDVLLTSDRSRSGKALERYWRLLRASENAGKIATRAPVGPSTRNRSKLWKKKSKTLPEKLVILVRMVELVCWLHVTLLLVSLALNGACTWLQLPLPSNPHRKKPIESGRAHPVRMNPDLIHPGSACQHPVLFLLVHRSVFDCCVTLT